MTPDPGQALEVLDQEAVVLYLEVPASKVVLLQAYFELYEGVGVVRTLNIRTSLICILTTNSMLNDTLRVLEAIQAATLWKFAPRPSEAERERYLGYFSHASNHS